MTTSYFCHKCSNRCASIERIDGEVRCGRCHEGFVEELSSEDGSSTPPASGTSVPDISLDDDPFDMFPTSPFSRLFSQIIRQRGGPSSSSHPQNSQQGSRTSGPRPSSHRRQGGEEPNGDAESQPNDPMTAFLNQLLSNLVAHTDNSDGRARIVLQFGGPAPGGGGGMFNIHGNLNDYAWGPNGLDDVLTALLNQFDAAQEQARALRPEDIARLPMTKVNHKQVDNSTQCTTCMETFSLDEEVAKLNCEHIFHKACIEPWLKRNNTCPICRQQIDPKNWGPNITDVDELD